MRTNPGRLSQEEKNRTLPWSMVRLLLLLWPFVLTWRAPTQHKTKWDTLITVPLHALLFPLHVSPVKPFQDRHWPVKTGPIKSWIFSFQCFGRQHLPCCQGHLSASFCIWSALTAPLTLIINFIYGNFSLNHAYNGTGYVEKNNPRKELPERSTCLPWSEQHVSSLPVWFSLQAHVREPTSHTNTK